MSEIYFSVDVEADGPIPGLYSMSSFGVVMCGLRDNQGNFSPDDVDWDDNCFYRELMPISDQYVPEAAAVSGLDRIQLITNGVRPEEAMKDLVSFVVKFAPFGARPIFVGWPASYDWTWLYWYMMTYGGVSPFGFSGAIDMKTWYAAKSGLQFNKFGKRDVYKALGVKPRPHTHNALDDAREQAVLWQNLIGWSGNA